MAVTPTQVFTRFPELATTDPAKIAMVEAAIAEGELILDPDFYGTLYDTAILYYAADALAQGNFATETDGTPVAGALSSINVTDGGYSLSYADSSSSGGGTGAIATMYGGMLASLRKRLALVQKL